MFLESQNVRLLATDLPDTTLLWKEFEQTVTLIVIASGATKHALDLFLDAVFGAIVLFVGIDQIKARKNVERLKKDARLCTPIVDRLLHSLDLGERMSPRTDIVHMTECVLTQETHLLRVSLEAYVECLDSIYGCVLVHGFVAAATEAWWSLAPIERKLLLIAATIEGTCTTRDIPVFLPCRSPAVAFRLVSVTLINHVHVLALCGPTPELTEIEKFAVHCWKNAIDSLHSVEQSSPKHFPIPFDSDTLGILLANYRIQKFVLARNNQCAKNRAAGSHRLDILRTFYHQAVETFMLTQESVGGSTDSDCAKETYLCSEYHKCHALKHGDHVLCVLYASTVPTHTARLSTQRIFKTLLIDKQASW